MNKKVDYINLIFGYLNEFTQMELEGVFISCPYWVNKLRLGKEIVRGFLNGKGDAFEINLELKNKLLKYPKKVISPTFIKKLALRERIGIDCSGFVYRILNKLIKIGWNRKIGSLENIFIGGINRTNADTLSSKRYAKKINLVRDIVLGDILRISGGKHIAIILENKDDRIVYAHSSSKTFQTGVHIGIIKIIDINKSIENQIWLEKTQRGEDYKKKYFNEKSGDGIFRLKGLE